MIFYKYEVWFKSHKGQVCLDSRYHEKKIAERAAKDMFEKYGVVAFVHEREIPKVPG